MSTKYLLIALIILINVNDTVTMLVVDLIIVLIIMLLSRYFITLFYRHIMPIKTLHWRQMAKNSYKFVIYQHSIRLKWVLVANSNSKI